VLRYLNEMNDDQTLSLYSGHPLGLFPSNKDAPRVVITNGMMIPHYSTNELYDKFFALGVTQYGQMTAGSFCYIGPQGIVHGTTVIMTFIYIIPLIPDYSDECGSKIFRSRISSRKSLCQFRQVKGLKIYKHFKGWVECPEHRQKPL
jgi:hypothetical protein